jgi:hypothetical protein
MVVWLLSAWLSQAAEGASSPSPAGSDGALEFSGFSLDSLPSMGGTEGRLRPLDHKSSLGGVLDLSQPAPASAGAAASRSRSGMWSQDLGASGKWQTLSPEGVPGGQDPFERAAGVRDYGALFGMAADAGVSPEKAPKSGAPSSSPLFSPREMISGSITAPGLSSGFAGRRSVDPILSPAWSGSGSHSPAEGVAPSLPSGVAVDGADRSRPTLSGVGAVYDLKEGLIPRTVRELIGGGVDRRSRDADLRLLGENPTLTELNPYLPNRAGDLLQTDPLRRRETFGRSAASSISPRYSNTESPLRDMTSKILGPSSLAPALALPLQEPTRTPAQPSRDEGLTRKF